MKNFQLNKYAENFLMYSCFGCTIDNGTGFNRDNIAVKCIQKAYLDLARTIKFKFSLQQLEKMKNKKSADEEKKQAKKYEDEKTTTIEEVNGCILSKLNERDIRTNFDDWHSDICKHIKNVMNTSKILEQNSFTYGQAQKWLNMTIKYMWLLGLWEDTFEGIADKLHVPVDSYIIEAVWSLDADLYELLPIKENKDINNGYKDDIIKKWSAWDESEYKAFQYQLRKCLKATGETPLEWECRKWIDTASKRSG